MEWKDWYVDLEIKLDLFLIKNVLFYYFINDVIVY